MSIIVGYVRGPARSFTYASGFDYDTGPLREEGTITGHGASGGHTFQTLRVTHTLLGKQGTLRIR